MPLQNTDVVRTPSIPRTVSKLLCAGKKCPATSTPDLCRECCTGGDCPNNALGSK